MWGAVRNDDDNPGPLLLLRITVGGDQTYEGLVRRGHVEEEQDVVGILRLVTRAVPEVTAALRRETGEQLAKMFPRYARALYHEVLSAELVNPTDMTPNPGLRGSWQADLSNLTVGPTQMPRLEPLPPQTPQTPPYEPYEYEYAPGLDESNVSRELVDLAKQGKREEFFEMARCVMPVDHVEACWRGTLQRLGKRPPAGAERTVDLPWPGGFQTHTPPPRTARTRVAVPSHLRFYRHHRLERVNLCEYPGVLPVEPMPSPCETPRPVLDPFAPGFDGVETPCTCGLFDLVWQVEARQ